MRDNRDNRVTLSDFQRLQQALLETRQALYDSREREAKALEQLSRAPPPTVTARAFPPPPPRRRATTMSAHPPWNEGEAMYPAELNPFGAVPPLPLDCAGSKPIGCSSGKTAGSVQASMSGAVMQADARSSASTGAERVNTAVARVPMTRLATCDVLTMHERHVQHSLAQRQRWLLRLVFHAWRASHSQTCILRNMSSLATLLQARRTSDGTDATPIALPAALSRLIAERDEAGQTASGGGREQLRSVVDADVLAAELDTLEASYAHERSRTHALGLRCDAGIAALRELTLTAAAMHGHTLCALDAATAEGGVANCSSGVIPGLQDRSGR